MAEPQAALTPITEAAIFLVLTVDSGSEAEHRDLLADVSGFRRSAGFRIPEAKLTCWSASAPICGSVPGDALSCSEASSVREMFREIVC
jgi:hypothetical protein